MTIIKVFPNLINPADDEAENYFGDETGSQQYYTVISILQKYLPKYLTVSLNDDDLTFEIEDLKEDEGCDNLDDYIEIIENIRESLVPYNYAELENQYLMFIINDILLENVNFRKNNYKIELNIITTVLIPNNLNINSILVKLNSEDWNNLQGLVKSSILSMYIASHSLNIILDSSEYVIKFITPDYEVIKFIDTANTIFFIYNNTTYINLPNDIDKLIIYNTIQLNNCPPLKISNNHLDIYTCDISNYSKLSYLLLTNSSLNRYFVLQIQDLNKIPKGNYNVWIYQQEKLKLIKFLNPNILGLPINEEERLSNFLNNSFYLINNVIYYYESNIKYNYIDINNNTLQYYKYTYDKYIYLLDNTMFESSTRVLLNTIPTYNTPDQINNLKNNFITALIVSTESYQSISDINITYDMIINSKNTYVTSNMLNFKWF
jgi:hypothetical protein